MSYIGNTPTTQSFISGTDYFNGTGAQTAFTLSRTVASVNDIQAVVNNVVQVPNDAYTISGTTITFTSAPSAGTQNVYVRYLSTTTQAITPSQGTVSWSTLDSNVQGDLGISFKNRIINSNMAIDQRNAGASVTCDNNQAYAVDRFYAEDNSDGVFTVQQVADAPAGFINSLKATITTADSSLAGTQFAAICQQIEGYNFADFNFGAANAKTFTLSFWVKSSLTGTFGGSFRNSADNRCFPFTYTISSANTWEQKTITVAGDTTGTWVTNNGIGLKVWFSLGAGATYSGTAGSWQSSLFVSATGAVSVIGTNSATFQVTGVQLEVGTQATTFTTAGGSYGAELALCQRYYQQINGNAVVGTALYGMMGSGIVFNSTSADISIPLKVSMRATPTLAQSTTVIQVGGTLYTTTSVSDAGSTPNVVFARVGNAGSMTVGYGANLSSNNSTSGYFSMSAEL
jgi:hypothetical protein